MLPPGRATAIQVELQAAKIQDQIVVRRVAHSPHSDPGQLVGYSGLGNGCSLHLYDLGTKNGSFLNSQAVIEPVQLENGDLVQVSPHYTLSFVDSEATAPLLQAQRGVRIDEDARRVWVLGCELDPPLSGAQFALLRALVEPDAALVRPSAGARARHTNSCRVKLRAEMIRDREMEREMEQLRERAMEQHQDQQGEPPESPQGPGDGSMPGPSGKG